MKNHKRLHKFGDLIIDEDFLISVDEDITLDEYIESLLNFRRSIREKAGVSCNPDVICHSDLGVRYSRRFNEQDLSIQTTYLDNNREYISKEVLRVERELEILKDKLKQVSNE